jgi:hypothetical protein
MTDRASSWLRTAEAVLPESLLPIRVDLAERLAHYDPRWEAPHGPPGGWREGAPIGNGDFGALVYGWPDSLSFALGKTDLWDRHSDGRSSFKGASVSEPHAAYFNQDQAEFSRLCDEPEVATRQHATTAGMFRLHLQEADSQFSPHLRLSIHDGVADLSFVPAGIDPGIHVWGLVRTRSLVSRRFDVLAIHIEPTLETPGYTPDPTLRRNLEAELAPLGLLTWELSRAPHKPHPAAVPIEADHEGVCLLEQELLPDDGYVIGLMVDGGELRSQSQGARLTGDLLIPGTSPVTLYLTIVSRNDAEDPRQAARERLRAARRAGWDAVLESHRAWWAAYWRRGLLFVEDQAAERNHYVSLYLCASTIQPGKVSPGLQGVWVKENVPAWLGDYHSNVNLQAVYWGLFSNNRLDFLEPYVTCLERMAPQARRDTHEYFQLPGLRFPHAGSIDGFELTQGDWSVNLGVSVGGSAWLVQLLWQTFIHSQDHAFLRDRAWPLLRDVALFYEAYLRSDSSTGRLNLEPSLFYESACPRMECSGRNSGYELPMVRMALETAVRAAEVLGCEEDLRSRWIAVIDRLAEFPVADDESWIAFEGRDLRDVPTHFLSLTPVFPAELVSLWHGPEQWRKQAFATLANPLTANSMTGKAWPGGQGLREIIRLGLAEEALAGARFDPDKGDNANNANGLVHTWGGHFLQADHGPGMCSVLPDMLLLAPGGVMRLFPCWPSRLSATFHSLRAPGAFLVSADYKNGGVTVAMIQSLAGVELRLANPWSGMARIRDAGTGEVLLTTRESEFSLKTTASQILVLDREESPWTLDQPQP